MTAAAAWRPSADDVAAILAQRTGDRSGAAQGSFTASTVPTDVQVEALIAQVQGEVAMRIGAMPEELATPLVEADGPGATPAGHVVAVGAAAWVELQFWPDMAGAGRSPAEQLWERYQALLTALVAAAADLATDGDLGTAEPTPRPVAAFPDTVGAGLATTPWERW